MRRKIHKRLVQILCFGILGVTAVMITSFDLKKLPLNFIGQNINPADTFPVPSHYENLLFYVQRTSNTNTIVYELNMKDGKLDTEDPIHAYWRRYEEGGGTAELNYIQRKYAYGVDASLVDEKKGTYSVKFVSYKNKTLYLIKSARDNKYHIYTGINNKQCILKRVFVKIEGGSFWLPNVKYVELKGVDPDTGKDVQERIKP